MKKQIKQLTHCRRLQKLTKSGGKREKAAKKSASKRTFSLSTLTRSNTRKSVQWSKCERISFWPGQGRSAAPLPQGESGLTKRLFPPCWPGLVANFEAAAAQLYAHSSSRSRRALRGAGPKWRRRREGRAGRARPLARRAHAQQGARSRGPSARNVAFRGLAGRKWRLLAPLASSRLGAAAAPCP